MKILILEYLYNNVKRLYKKHKEGVDVIIDVMSMGYSFNVAHKCISDTEYYEYVKLLHLLYALDLPFLAQNLEKKIKSQSK